MFDFLRLSLRHRFLIFCCVGFVGLVVDVSITTLLNNTLHLGPAVSRCLAILLAIIVTFSINYSVTFSDRERNLFSSFSAYLVTQSVGATLNFFAYTWFVLVNPTVPLWVAIAFGSTIALIVNYFSADRLVFIVDWGYRRRFQSVGLVISGGIFILWPALINAGPFIFFDTSHYIGLGQSIFKYAEGFLLADPIRSQIIEPASSSQHASLTYAGGRSPFYSIPAYLSVFLGLWPLIIVQALIVSVTLFIFSVALTRSCLFFTIALLLCISITPLPFFASFVMPDIFAGVLLLGMISLFYFDHRLSTVSRWGLVGIATYAAAVHVSNLVLGSLLWILFGFIRNNASIGIWRIATFRALPLLIAALALSAFNQIVFWRLGSEIKSAPYVTARLLADGPGRLYLESTCDVSQITLCKYKDRGFKTQDDFLWSGDPHIGVFSVAPLADREAIKREEYGFAIKVFLDHPGDVIGAVLTNSFNQFFSFGVLSDFSMQKESFVKMNFDQILGPHSKVIMESRLYNGDIFFLGFDNIIYVTAIFGIIVLLGSIFILGSRAALPSLFLLSALILNALICGGISGVNDRYQARIIWLVPLLAAVNVSQIRKKLLINFQVTDADKAQHNSEVERATNC